MDRVLMFKLNVGVITIRKYTILYFLIRHIELNPSPLPLGWCSILTRDLVAYNHPSCCLFLLPPPLNFVTYIA